LNTKILEPWLNGEYLFHITNEKGLKGILHSRLVKPMTDTGWRRVTSFTADPLEVLHGVVFEEESKSIVMVFKKEELTKQGLREVEYTRKTYTPKDDLWWIELPDFEVETGWRHIEAVTIDGLVGVVAIVD
jgi:hypothetical protein